nr:zinc finger BED domain-containing protein RICESLEEPER 2-like [Coffea arabica]
MSSSPYNSHQGSSTSPIMDPSNEYVILVGGEEEDDEMHEDVDIEILAENKETNEAKPFQKKSRTLKSKVWSDMDREPQTDGSIKVTCKHCKEVWKMNASGTTTTYTRHLKNCLQKKLVDEGNKRMQQQVLSFTTETPSDGMTSITNFRYDHAKVRELASHMVLAHEYPFAMLDHEIFNKFMKAVSPYYIKISRQTVKKDCISTYELEKKKLMSLLKEVSKISITTDLWKSNQKIQYMVVTGHFIDFNWMLQKRVLNFCNVPPPHTGVIIADALNKCFNEWGIENKICSITVDNASYNDVCVRRLKDDFLLRKQLNVGGKYFHVRCCAHILNLLVQDGLSQIGEVIDTVREGIKYLNYSESRLIEFSKIKKQLRLSPRKLILDCPTRWNGTYLMLASAVEFKDVFWRYADIDLGFHYVPSEYDWMRVEDVCQFLGIFHEITNMISGSEYPTANIFLPELYRIKELLNEKSVNPSSHIRAMAASMASKFHKYWGESNILLSLGAILDPRYKMVLIDYAFPIIYGSEAAPIYIAEIKEVLNDLCNEYVSSFTPCSTEDVQLPKCRKAEISHACSSTSMVVEEIGKNVLTGKAKFEMHVSSQEEMPPKESELDIYLSEKRYSGATSANLDVLSWWRQERWRFRVLSKLAADILAIPVTTVASESTFSAGGRVIDGRRASMFVDTVQMLLCANNWVRNLHGLSKSHLKESSIVDDFKAYEEVILPD